MKLINSSVEIIPQEPDLLGVYKQIEIGGRTAYKSEDRITEDSAKAFVDMLISRGHTAPLEQGTIYLKFPINGLFNQIEERWKKYEENPYSKVNINATDIFTWNAYVTTNARVIQENKWQDDLQYLCTPTQYHEKRVTVRFICSRSIANELVRHRAFSFVQESTRYCNYTKTKFGNQITYIRPSWSYVPLGEYYGLDYDYETDRSYVFINGKKYVFDNYPLDSELSLSNKDFNLIQPLYYSEQNYLIGLNNGASPQQMREVLPNALKTEVVMTGFIKDWIYFFDLRMAPSAHPDMRELTTLLHTKFIDNQLLSGVC